MATLRYKAENESHAPSPLNQLNHANRYMPINYIKILINRFCEFKEERNYHTPKLGGCQGPNADGQFTRPFGTDTYNL